MKRRQDSTEHSERGDNATIEERELKKRWNEEKEKVIKGGLMKHIFDSSMYFVNGM